MGNVAAKERSETQQAKLMRALVTLAFAFAVGCDPPIVLLHKPPINDLGCPPATVALASDFDLKSFEIPDTRDFYPTRSFREIDGAIIVVTSSLAFRIDETGLHQVPNENRLSRAVNHDIQSGEVWSVSFDGQVARETTSIGTVDLTDIGNVDIAPSGEGALVGLQGVESTQILRVPSGEIVRHGVFGDLHAMSQLPGRETLAEFMGNNFVVPAFGDAVRDLSSRGWYWAHPRLGLATIGKNRFCILSEDNTESRCWLHGSPEFPPGHERPYGEGFLTTNLFGEVTWTSPDGDENIASLVNLPRDVKVYRDGFLVVTRDIDAWLGDQYFNTDIVVYWFERSECAEYTSALRPRSP